MVFKKGVILTKDNLAKRNWKGDTKCCFCSSSETIQHLFFDCHVARFVWNAVYVVFGIQPPTSMSFLLGSWLGNFSRKLQKHILVGASALCWTIWLSRNDVVFQKTIPNSYLQVIFRGIYWARCWSQLSKEEEKLSLKKRACSLESTVMAFYSKHGWNFRNRLKLLVCFSFIFLFFSCVGLV